MARQSKVGEGRIAGGPPGGPGARGGGLYACTLA
jgi:hypothetical protein